MGLTDFPLSLPRPPRPSSTMPPAQSSVPTKEALSKRAHRLLPEDGSTNFPTPAYYKHLSCLTQHLFQGLDKFIAGRIHSKLPGKTYIDAHPSLFRDLTESIIIATIHHFDVRYCLFRNPLVTHNSYNTPCISLVVIISYCVFLSLVPFLVPFAPCIHLGYSILSTMYDWISTLVAIPACLIPLLLLLVISCHLYTSVLGLGCFAT